MSAEPRNVVCQSTNSQAGVLRPSPIRPAGRSRPEGQRLQECERSTEYVSACEHQEGRPRLDRVLGEQKGCCDEIGNAQDGLKNRNEAVDGAHLNICERRNDQCDGKKNDNDASAVLRCLAVAGIVAITIGKS